MSLTLKISKVAVKFEVSDEDAETVVTLFAEDGAEVLIRKLRKVIDLVEPEAPHLALRLGEPPFRAEMVPGVRVKDAMKPPEIPDRLKGEVEMDDWATKPVIENGWKGLGDGEGLPSA